MQMNLPSEVMNIIDTLEKAGFEAFAVGGCVRDRLLGVEPKDWDITTSALPEEVKKLFPITIDTGIQHGTVTVLKNHVGFEVTTYRIDGEYEDGRHPKQVTFTSNLVEDLKRRDFTINAMAYNEKVGLVDEFQGAEDLKNHLVRCVGNPKERFTEDALRMLRAVRFAAKLNCSIDPQTLLAMEELAPSLEKVSAERIYTEFYKTLISPNPQLMELAYTSGLMKVFLPELQEPLSDPKLRAKVWQDLALSVPDLHVREALLFTYLPGGGEEAAKILHRLKTDREAWEWARHLLAWKEKLPSADEVSLRKFLSQEGVEFWPKFYEYRKVKNPELIDQLEGMQKTIEQILARGDCLFVKDLKLNGKDLIAMGVPKGSGIGEVLDDLLNYCIEEPDKNDEECLRARVISLWL